MRSVGRAIGLDVHRDFCEVAIGEAGGFARRVGSRRRRSGLELFAQSLGRGSGGVGGDRERVGDRADPRAACRRGWSWSAPDDTGIRQARAKTDRLDARTLARLLWAGELEAVWTPDEQTPRVAPAAGAARAAGARALARQERDPRRARCAACRASRRAPTCSASRAASGWRARAAGRGARDGRRRACATSSSSTRRSPRSSG